MRRAGRTCLPDIIISAAASVEVRKEEINELTISVPDGDTGTNMS
jgi:dihydroxyacetone kinase-like predicted kinase